MFGVFVLRLHVVVLGGQGLDLVLLLFRVLYALLLQLFHVFLELHDGASHGNVLSTCSRGVVASRLLFALFCTL